MLRVAITGAATGLGSVIAKHFLKDGCRVMICDVDQPALDDFQACYPEVLISRTDVSNESEVRRFFEKIGNEMEGLDVLVNNAGIAGPTAPIELIDAAEWRKTISVDLDGVFYCLKYAIPLLKQAPAGSIVNIASTAGLMGFANRSPYTACKWALIGLTKTLAMELGPYKVRCNAVCPGSIAGERIERIIKQDADRRGVNVETVREVYLSQSSMHKFVTADEVARIVTFLCTATSISGQSISVDGHTESASLRC
ncbi:MAG: SDR family oxidoreductase [Gammaproteobacteria bacterium]|nr:SDR family oxidoreductase [Gammaproteobacteria bacterium]